jgi:hypothetical protein
MDLLGRGLPQVQLLPRPSDQATAIQRYTRMGETLRGCGREILFSICEWGWRAPWLWARKACGQMWRVTGNLVDSWTSILHHTWWSLGIDASNDIVAPSPNTPDRVAGTIWTWRWWA